MTLQMKAAATLIALLLSGCSGPKPPPGWPSGEERPINPSQITRAVK